MAWDSTDVEAWLGVDDATLDTVLLARVIDAVTTHAARHYAIEVDNDEHDQALVMQSARLYQRKYSPSGWSGSDDLSPVQVKVFDPDIARMLVGDLKTSGLFGPSTDSTSSVTLLSQLKQVDGAGSGLDADLLDGVEGAGYQVTPVPVGDVDATGTPSASTFLRGDGSWQTIAGGGDLISTNNLSDLDNAATSRTNLGVAIGSDVQAWSAVLDATTASFLTADETKLDGIAAGAQTGTLSNVSEDTTPTLGGTLDANAKSIENLGAVEEQVNTVATSGATETLDTSLYGVHDITMDQACTFTFSNPAPSGDMSSFVLILRGAFTPTLPASVDWSGGAAPTYTTPSVYTFVTVDAGTTWLGAQSGAAFA